MKPKDFLKERLFTIFNSLKNISIRYQYFNETNIHLVEISPCSFSENHDYVEMEKQLKSDFKKKFPLSKLIFSYDYPNLRMKHPDFSFSRINGKSVIHTRSVKNYSPYFKLTVTSDSESLNTI